ncbi:MAG: PQQ-binding-like beta-propeller repeat protein [Polyangiaceae bacterium]
MLLKCERCGAPLEVPAGGSERCPYCGTTATAAAPAPPPPAAPPYGYAQGHGHVHAHGAALREQMLAQVRAQTVKRTRGVGRIIGAFSVMAVVGAVGAGLIPLLTSVTTSAPALQKALGKVASGGGLTTLGLTSWSSSDSGCLIDANGDGVLDIAGLSGASDNNQATVVDGNTGNVLFTAPAVKKAEQLGCLGANGFFVVQGNFLVDFYTARSPWGKTSVMARDKVSAYGSGQGCVQLRTDDGTTQGIQLPSGVATTCPATVRRYYEAQPGLMGLTDHSTQLTVGARKYAMSTRATGTEILTISVTEGSKLIWTKELPYASCTFGAGIAVVGSQIVLWAAEPSERSNGLIVGLNEATGNQLYEVPVTDSVTNNPRFFMSNGKYVLAVSWGALRAYDPATGSEAWRVGR